MGQRGENGLVAVVDRDSEQPEGLGGDFGVFGDASYEDGGDEVLHVQAENVAGVLGCDERGQVPFAGVAGEPDQERAARAPDQDRGRSGCR